MDTAPAIKDHSGFTQHYSMLRSKENRIYTTSEIRALPFIAKDHLLSAEWKIRRQSTDRLLSYLRKLNRPLNVLEVGCGNGWLSHRLSEIPQTNVTGLDLHEPELQQAASVFGEIANLRFRYADFLSTGFEESFDIILFAASIQYFPSFADVIEKALIHLSDGGEIHILDSHFYEDEELSFAASRSAMHFSEMDVPGMSAYYFHHTLSDLDKFNKEFLYAPSPIRAKLGIPQHPFPWIRIKQGVSK